MWILQAAHPMTMAPAQNGQSLPKELTEKASGMKTNGAEEACKMTKQNGVPVRLFNRVASLILIQFLLASSMGFGSGHTTPNGGGLGEMQMTASWSGLSHALQICFGRQFNCDLTVLEQRALSDLLNYKQRCFPELIFAPLMTQQLTRTGACGQAVTFNSRALADEGRRPLPQEQVGILALRALCEVSGRCPQFVSTFQKVQNIMTTTVFAGAFDPLAGLVIRREATTDQMNVVHGLQSQSLNDLLQLRLRCQSVAQLRFESVEFAARSDRAELKSRMFFQCGGKKGDRRLAIVFEKQNGVWIVNPQQVLVF